MKVTKLIIAFLFSMAWSGIYGQNESTQATNKEVTQEAFDKISSAIDYTKTNKAVRPKKRDKKKKKEEDKAEEKEEEKEKNPNIFQSLPIFQVLSYILIAMLVVALLYFIFSRIENEKKFERSDTYHIEEEIEDINDVDTVSLLQKALERGDYRYAVRMQFLSVLQSLAKKEKITWRKEKTNHEYARELRRAEYAYDFQNLVNIFDYVWYGKREVTKELYAQIDQQYNSFKTKMNE